MSRASRVPPATLLDALRVSFDATLRPPEGVASPVALLWTDADGQWRPLIASLRIALPQLYALGSYDPHIRQGPVIWLKCIVDRTLPDVSPPDGVTPILYLPGVSRRDLRAGVDCPRYLQPLIELQYRGAEWHQRNGRDWTVEAFLTSEHGLGLEIAQDANTRQAMFRALPILATEPVQSLRGRRLDAEDFDRLAVGDPIRDLLSWLSGPEAYESQHDTNRWETFREVCIREFGFDPERDGAAAAADALLNDGGRWNDVWQRFREAPRAYAGLSPVLRQAHQRNLLVEESRRPDINEEHEDQLRRDLSGLGTVPHSDACARVIVLEEQHARRRDWVWAQLGESPLAVAMEPLGRLARLAKTPLGGASVEAMARDYASEGWRCDRAALDALLTDLSHSQSDLVAKVVRALYEPWLDKSTRRFQELMRAAEVDLRRLVAGISAERDTCLLFVDGLRFDVAGLLQDKLEARRFRVLLTHRVAPLPTVTATAKPATTPVRDACVGSSSAEDFAPMLVRNQQPATASRLREEMARQGIEVLEADEVRLSTSSDGGAWTEMGKFDKLGHALGLSFLPLIDDELDRIVERVSGLIDAGWLRVRIVTDHGWLALPGGLPKVELPPYHVATKWARCASVRGESTPSVPTHTWYWNDNARIASPPGIGVFVAGTEYAHGGVSLQECVIPDMTIQRGEEVARATIMEVTWHGMRCHVKAAATTPHISIDIRLNWRQPATSIVIGAKELDQHGIASLVVADDKHEGAGASVVALDPSGRLLHYKVTTVGGGS